MRDNVRIEFEMRVAAAALLLLAVAVRALPQQQPVALPPHLLRQYLAQNQQGQQRPEATPIYERQPEPQQSFVRVQPKEQPQPQYVQQYVQQPQPQPQYRPKPQAARPASPRPEEQLPEDYDPNPSYQFGFDVNDDQYTNYQNRQEERQGGVIKGSYSVVDSDGFVRTVTYTADPKEGFKAEVVRQPTDIKVKVPVPTAAAPLGGLRHQQAAQYLEASAPAPGPQQYYRYQQQRQQR